MTKAGVILLAGGKSSRMGTNKALLTLDGKKNIERIAAQLSLFFPEITIVMNDPDEYRSLHLPMTSDYYPGKGPLAGIHAGLMASNYETNLIVACDMPFVSGELGFHLVQQSSEYDAVVPKINHKLQPLFAVYKKTGIEQMEKCLKSEQLRIQELLMQLNVLYLTEDELQANANFERAFFNMNTPKDYKLAEKWASEGE